MKPAGSVKCAARVACVAACTGLQVDSRTRKGLTPLAMAVQGGEAGVDSTSTSVRNRHQQVGHGVGSTHASIRDGYHGRTATKPALEMGTSTGTSRGTIDGQQNSTQVFICRREGHSPAPSCSVVSGVPHSKRLLCCQPPTNL